MTAPYLPPFPSLNAEHAFAELAALHLAGETVTRDDLPPALLRDPSALDSLGDYFASTAKLVEALRGER